ncbi:MAG: HD domain-containing protein [Fibromonadaceae bacterium]|jgi:HD-GYP domain-containing protein (c-di-GMP phosphodiesterase class II)|nr:HD domain-containing protein [Fibromonadaceae bacterium]
MIQIALKELRVGHALARSIYRDTGEIMLSTGYKVTPEIITRLSGMGIDRVWVHEEGLEDLENEDTIPEIVVNQSVLLLRKTILSFRSKIGLGKINPNETPPSPEQILSKPERVKEVFDLAAFKKVAADIFQELKRADPSILYITGTRSIGNFYQQQSVECAIVAAFLAKRFNYSPDEVEDLILAVLLMDIGYMLLPEHLLNPMTKLTLEELELKRRHADYGFDILRICNTSLICSNIALQHHERQDGGGYPRKLTGSNKPPVRTTGSAPKGSINRFAEIAAVALDYVSLIAPPPGIAAQTPIGSIKFLVRLSGSKLNSSIVETLLSMIPVYSAGDRIMVTTDPTGELIGFVGVVTKPNTREQNRPSIVLIYDRAGKKIPAIKMNLWERTSIDIKEVKLGEVSEPIEEAVLYSE